MNSMIKCNHCCGINNCSSCHGAGSFVSYSHSGQPYTINCPSCCGSKACFYCNNTGYVKDPNYFSKDTNSVPTLYKCPHFYMRDIYNNCAQCNGNGHKDCICSNWPMLSKPRNNNSLFSCFTFKRRYRCKRCKDAKKIKCRYCNGNGKKFIHRKCNSCGHTSRVY